MKKLTTSVAFVGALFVTSSASAQTVLFSDDFDPTFSAGAEFLSGAGAYSYGYDSTPSGGATKAINNYDQWMRQGTNSIASDLDSDGDLELRPNKDTANNGKMWSVILDPVHFVGQGGNTLTLSVDLIGADDGAARVYLSSARGYDATGSNDLIVTASNGGLATSNASGTGSTVVTEIFDDANNGGGIAIADTTVSGSFTQDFTYTEGDALIVSFGAYNSAIGFDNLSISAVPEPSSYALLAGALALTSVMLRRRHV